MLSRGLICLTLLFLSVQSWQEAGPRGLLCKKRNPYLLSYRKDLPWGDDIHRDVEVDDITDGRPTILALHTAHCLYCTTQAKYLGNMARDLQDYGTNISIIIVNHARKEEYIDYYMKHIKMFDHVYFMQDNWDTNAWRDLRGRKDDFYIYDSSQRLVKYVAGSAGSLTNFNWRDELYDLMGKMAQGYSPCDEGSGDVQGEVPEQISEFYHPHPAQCRQVTRTLSTVIGLQTQTPVILYFTDASVQYSINQAIELALFGQKLNDNSAYVQVIFVNSARAEAYQQDLTYQVEYYNQAVQFVQDTPELGLFNELRVGRDDLMILDTRHRLKFFNKSPKTDMIYNEWREKLQALIEDDSDSCSKFQKKELLCKRYVDWSFDEVPFSWMTYDRFTVLSILKEGQEGITQFNRIKEARSSMGYMPINHVVMNPGSQEGQRNARMLGELERGARVYFINDHESAEDSIMNKLYGSPGDIFYYDTQGVLRAVDQYSARYDLKSNIRQQYKADTEPCTGVR